MLVQRWLPRVAICAPLSLGTKRLVVHTLTSMGVVAIATQTHTHILSLPPCCTAVAWVVCMATPRGSCALTDSVTFIYSSTCPDPFLSLACTHTYVRTLGLALLSHRCRIGNGLLFSAPFPMASVSTLVKSLGDEKCRPSVVPSSHPQGLLALST